MMYNFRGQEVNMYDAVQESDIKKKQAVLDFLVIAETDDLACTTFQGYIDRLSEGNTLDGTINDIVYDDLVNIYEEGEEAMCR